MTPVEATLVRRRAQRPPLVALDVDITLRNEDAQPRWWLVATTAGPDVAALGSAGVHSVLVEGVARFSGPAPFGALQLAAGDEVTLHGWTVTVWDDPPVDTVEVGVVDAAEVVIGGSPIGDWIARGTWPGRDLEPFPVDLVDARRATVRIG